MSDDKSDKYKMVFAVIKNITGTIDFDAVSKEIQVANAEAARKRFKRFLEKESVAVGLVGSKLGNPEAGGAVAPKTPSKPKNSRTPKASDKRKAAGGMTTGAEDDDEEDADAIDATPVKKKKKTVMVTKAQVKEAKEKASDEDVDGASELQITDADGAGA